MATAAAHKVQGITELLEMVLYELPPIDILVYQRVCQRWKDIITHGEKFQQALFFKPATNGTLKPRKERACKLCAAELEEMLTLNQELSESWPLVWRLPGRTPLSHSASSSTRCLRN